MQRQSLGSPSPRINAPVRGSSFTEISAASPSPASPSSSPVTDSGTDNNDIKLDKLLRRRSSPPPIPTLRNGPEKYIHLIPILILLCFFVLFLCSREPSSTELARFNGFRHPSELADSRAIDETERVLAKSDILAIRILRNLQENKREGNKSSRSHRKLGDF